MQETNVQAPRDQGRSVFVSVLLTASVLLACACGDSMGPGERELARVTFTRSPSYDTVFVVDVDSGSIRQRVALPLQAALAHISPSGDRVALLHQNQLWVTGLDGTGGLRISSEASSLAWSPNGTRLAYVRTSSPRELRVVNVDGSGDVAVGGAVPGGWGLAWSPDGGRIAFEALENGRRTVNIIRTDGTGLQDVSQYLPDPGERSSGEPAWSPDGRNLVLSSFTRLDYPDTRYKLWVVTLATGEAHGLGSWAGVRPSWSPTGALIAFLGYPPSSQAPDVFVVRPDGSGLRQVTHTLGEAEESPGWIQQ